jgi:hypothetical protein
MPTHSRWNRRAVGACLCALASATLLLSGCAQLLGIDELGQGGRDAAPPDARPPIDAPIDAIPIDTTCNEGPATDGTGATIIDTDPAGNEFTATCGGESSPDQMLLWTAPVTDYYVFDTFGSGFDTVLALFDQCGGNELACSNNVGDAVQSELVYKLVQGQQALVLVDGAAGDSGQGTLNIQRVACPDSDLEGQTFPLELSTLGFGDDQSACGGAGQEDRAYHWVAPADGLYYVRATSESFTPVVSLLDGPRCTDRVLGCNPAVSGQYGAEVVRFLRAGQSVSIVVDGTDGAGLFTLDIGLKADQQCPESELIDGTFSDDFTAPTLSSSCGATRTSGFFGELYEVPDKVYFFSTPGFGPGCGGSCTVSITAPQSVVLYAIEGNECSGAEIECKVLTVDAATNQAAGSISLPIGAEARFYTVVVADRFVNDQGAGFTVTFSCAAVC